MARLLLAALLVLTCALPSCGYRIEHIAPLTTRYGSVCIPYVAGDCDGILTDCLIRTLVANQGLGYRQEGAPLLLQVAIVGREDRNIGFNYAPADQGDNDFNRIVVANEARLSMSAEVTLIDRSTGNIVLGPTCISSFLDYDFEPDLSNVNVQAFALGQLEMQAQAQDAAYAALMSLLATKIVDLINHSW